VVVEVHGTNSNLDWKLGNGYEMDHDYQAPAQQCDIRTSATRNHESQMMSAKQQNRHFSLVLLNSNKS